ncbi:unnamed protein product [Paramecium primaurelia]|uniref:Uncharacterized protein n=1 Tax=Paramecium primaurelia TaxID=5886 RepID=A0A8S1QM54_PARPR|nr:unnamed protein product [Paramecium primaurelia]
MIPKIEQKINYSDLVKILFFVLLKWVRLENFHIFEDQQRMGDQLQQVKYLYGLKKMKRMMHIYFLQYNCAFQLSQKQFGNQFLKKLRKILINLVYYKLTELSAFSIVEANIGKIQIQSLMIYITGQIQWAYQVDCTYDYFHIEPDQSRSLIVELANTKILNTILIQNDQN